jgi:phosphoglucomutase
VVRKGKEGEEEIRKMMDDFRNKPPQVINGSKVVLIHDYLTGKSMDLRIDLESQILLPRSNVLQFMLEDGTKISVRPSGTEPKIKFYFSVNEKLEKAEDFISAGRKLDDRIRAIQLELKLL